MAQKLEFVIKPGYFEKKRFGAKQPGLDLTRVVFDALKDQSLVVTNDCCTYFPSIPVITEVRRAAGVVPVGGLVLIYDADNDEYDLVYINADGTEYRAVGILPLAV